MITRIPDNSAKRECIPFSRLLAFKINMSYFQVLLNGKNFLVELDDKEELLGFITTRWVKASNSEEAELKAIDLIKYDQHLLEITKNISGSELSPMIYLDKMCNVNWFTYFRRKPGGGYSFYPMASGES
jgi:hypothetical protein